MALIKQVVVEVIFEAGDGAGEGAEGEEGAGEDFSPAIQLEVYRFVECSV